MDILAEIAFWGFWSIVKFIVTPSAMIVYGKSVLYTIFVTSLGAAVGVQIFYHMGRLIFNWIYKRKGKKEKIVTPMKRRIVSFKNNFGIVGLLLICGIISVPISSVLMAKYFDKYRFSVWYLTIAFTIWSVVLTLSSYYLKDVLKTVDLF